jgi:hypothetical protein
VLRRCLSVACLARDLLVSSIGKHVPDKLQQFAVILNKSETSLTSMENVLARALDVQYMAEVAPTSRALALAPDLLPLGWLLLSMNTRPLPDTCAAVVPVPPPLPPLPVLAVDVVLWLILLRTAHCNA